MVETVWGLCKKSKWVRMATCYVFYLFIYCQMGQSIHTEGVGRESRKKAKKLQDPKGHRVT